MSLLIPHSQEYFIVTTDSTSRNLSIVENNYLSDDCIKRMQATAFDGSVTDYKQTFGMFLVNPITEYANKQEDVVKHLMTACNYNHIPSNTLSCRRSHLLGWISDRLKNGETIEAFWFDTYPYNMFLGPCGTDEISQGSDFFGFGDDTPMRIRFMLSLLPVPCVVTVVYDASEAQPRFRVGITFTTYKYIPGRVLMKDRANMFVDMQELASLTTSVTARFLYSAYPTDHADIKFPVLEANDGNYQTFAFSPSVVNGMLAHINAKWKGVPYDSSEGRKQLSETMYQEYNWDACSDSTLFLLRAAEESGAFTWKAW